MCQVTHHSVIQMYHQQTMLYQHHLYIWGYHLYKARKRVPSTEPCGTPTLIPRCDEQYPFIIVNCFRLLSSLRMKSFTCPRKPYVSNFHNKMPWSTVSNAFLRCKYIPKAYCFPSNIVLILFVRSIRASNVESFSLNPYCCKQSIACFSMKCKSLL